MEDDPLSLGTGNALKKFEEFAQRQEKIKSLQLDLWKSIITVHAAILGISIPLMGFTEKSIHPILAATWVLQIVSIGCGLLLSKIHIDLESRISLQSLKSGLDFNKINRIDAEMPEKGPTDKKKLAGMLIAAMMEITPRKEGDIFAKYGKDLAAKYENELPSRKLFKEKKPSLVKALTDFLVEKRTVLTSLFYCSSAVSFITLLWAVLAR